VKRRGEERRGEERSDAKYATAEGAKRSVKVEKKSRTYRLR
jgi:hypothetical protein